MKISPPCNGSAKVLVTGGAGFVGSHICEQLLLEGKRVVVVDILNSETSTLEEKRQNLQHLQDVAADVDGAQFSVYQLDILQEDLLAKILREERPTSCVHAASLVMDRKSVDQPMRYILNNVQGTQSLLNAIRQTETIKRLVFISTRSAVGETPSAHDKTTENDLLRPINPYGATKVAAEALLHTFHKNFGLSVSICRMQPIFGPRCRRDMIPRLLFESVLYGKKIEKYGNGEAVRDWLFVKDAALGVLAALKDSGKFSIFNFGTGVCTSLNELIQMVLAISGGKLNIAHADIPIGDAVYAGMCDNHRAKDILGWEPKTDLRTGLILMHKYMANQIPVLADVQSDAEDPGLGEKECINF